LLLTHQKRGVARREPVGAAELVEYALELEASRQLLSSDPLHGDETAVRLTRRNGALEKVDGPFLESKEVIGGFFVLEAKDDAEALALAKRCPAARAIAVTLHPALREAAKRPAVAEPRFMLLFGLAPDFEGDADGSKYLRMMSWLRELESE